MGKLMVIYDVNVEFSCFQNSFIPFHFFTRRKSLARYLIVKNVFVNSHGLSSQFLLELPKYKLA